jgi:hypothetical protein
MVCQYVLKLLFCFCLCITLLVFVLYLLSASRLLYPQQLCWRAESDSGLPLNVSRFWGVNLAILNINVFSYTTFRSRFKEEGTEISIHEARSAVVTCVVTRSATIDCRFGVFVDVLEPCLWTENPIMQLEKLQRNCFFKADTCCYGVGILRSFSNYFFHNTRSFLLHPLRTFRSIPS